MTPQTAGNIFKQMDSNRPLGYIFANKLSFFSRDILKSNMGVYKQCSDSLQTLCFKRCLTEHLSDCFIDDYYKCQLAGLFWLPQFIFTSLHVDHRTALLSGSWNRWYTNHVSFNNRALLMPCLWYRYYYIVQVIVCSFLQ